MDDRIDVVRSFLTQNPLAGAWLQDRMEAIQSSLSELSYAEVNRSSRILDNKTGVALYWFQSFTDSTLKLLDAPVKFILEHGLTVILVPTDTGLPPSVKLWYHWRVLDDVDTLAASVDGPRWPEDTFDTAREITAHCFGQGRLSSLAVPKAHNTSELQDWLTHSVPSQLEKWTTSPSSDERQHLKATLVNAFGVAGENRLGATDVCHMLNDVLATSDMARLSQAMLEQFHRQAQSLGLSLAESDKAYVHDVALLSDGGAQGRMTVERTLQEQETDLRTIRATWFAKWSRKTQQLHLTLKLQAFDTQQVDATRVEHCFDLRPLNLTTKTISDQKRILRHSASLQPWDAQHSPILESLLQDCWLQMAP